MGSVAESYTIELTEADTTEDSDKKLFGSDDSYVAVNGAEIQLKITGGSKAFDGQVTVIDAETGIRSAVTGSTSGTTVTYSNIPLSGVGTYVIMIQGEDLQESITLRVIAQTAGSTGVGFVVIGS